MGHEDRVAELVELTRAECFELLGRLEVGRFAVNRRAGSPYVVPVNYVVDDDCVVFRSGPGTKLSALRDRPVSFEVDWVDPIHRVGWSVLVEGIAHEMTPEEAARLELDAWAPGLLSHWIRIIPGSVTGRRIQAAWVLGDARAYL